MAFTISNLALADSEKLSDIHTGIEKDYPALSHIDGDHLERTLGVDFDMVLFDVREPDEFKVSHIEGAIRVDPDITTRDFLSKYEERISGKTAVFYCSVGRRSSELADRVELAMDEHDHTKLMNLEHGIFGWHDESRALVDDHGGTEFIHPYNAWWGRILDRHDRIRYRATE